MSFPRFSIAQRFQHEIAEPRVIMSDLSNSSRSSAQRSDYVWQYEYYDDDQPVSFEGLRANRYSIVIGFWVGLAVFVFFTFFVLTLLTKTRAPHQANPEPADTHQPPSGCLVEINSPQEENAPFTRPLLSRSQSHFHIREEGQDSGKQMLEDTRFGEQNRLSQGSCHQLRGGSSSRMGDTEEDLELAVSKQPLHGHAGGIKADRAYAFFTQLTIPHLVSLDHSSAVGEDELLYEPSVVLVQQDHSPGTRCDIH